VKKAIFLIVVLTGVFLSSCGGNQGTKVTVTIATADGQASMPLSVAYQIEDGEWEWLQPNAEAGYDFYVPAGKKRYGVAVRCGGLKYHVALNYARAAIYQLTTADTTEPVFTCPADMKSAIVEISYDARAIAGAASVAIFTRKQTKKLVGVYSSNPKKVEFYPPGKHDLLFTAYSQAFSTQPRDLLAARLVRNVNIEDGAEVELSLNGDDLVQWANVDSFSKTANWHGSYAVGLVTPSGAAFRGVLGSGNDSGGPYARVANAGSDDYYLLAAEINKLLPSGNKLNLKYFHYLSAASAGNLQVRFPDPLPESYEADGSSGRWRFELEHFEGARGLRLSSEVMGKTAVKVWVSPSWLQGLNGYTIPDLASVPGFAAFDNPADGYWGYCVLGGDATLAEILSLPRGKNQLLPTGIEKPAEVTFSCIGGM